MRRRAVVCRHSFFTPEPLACRNDPVYWSKENSFNDHTFQDISRRGRGGPDAGRRGTIARGHLRRGFHLRQGYGGQDGGQAGGGRTGSATTAAATAPGCPRR